MKTTTEEKRAIIAIENFATNSTANKMKNPC